MKYAEYPLSAPVNITWEITHQCNLACIHCLSGSGAASPDELDESKRRNIADQLAALKVFEINFGGGEPFLDDGFLPLLDYIHRKDIVTCISTNGTVLTDEIVTRLSSSPLVNMQVSLDGPVPDINDPIRGAGTYARVIRGIERLAGKDIPLSINTVVTSRNFRHLHRMKELAASYGASLRVSRFRPSGRARDSWDRLRLTTLQLKELSAWLEDDPSILTGDSFFAISPDGRRKLGLDMCGAARMTACIDPVGSVYPCAFLQAPEFRGGNLREASFRDIWDGSPAFDYFRRLEPEACRECRRFETCRGGCPAVAYFVRGNLDSADPECLASWTKSC